MNNNCHLINEWISFSEKIQSFILRTIERSEETLYKLQSSFLDLSLDDDLKNKLRSQAQCLKSIHQILSQKKFNQLNQLDSIQIQECIEILSSHKKNYFNKIEYNITSGSPDKNKSKFWRPSYNEIVRAYEVLISLLKQSIK